MCRISAARLVFPGPKQRNWLNGLKVFKELFESIGQQPEGLDPIQQRVAIKILEKVRENIKGWYPELLRLVLMMIGPHGTKAGQAGTAFAILQDAVYAELKNLTLNFAHTDAKMEHFLPDYVSFDGHSGALIFNFPHGGGTVPCDVKALQIPPIDLTDPANFIVADRSIKLPK
jgi:hypothetical protein